MHKKGEKRGGGMGWVGGEEIYQAAISTVQNYK